MRRTVVLGVMCAGMFFVLLDVTIVNVALPAMRTDLHLDGSGLEWVVDVDTLGFACLMLAAGTLGDRTGRKRLILAGLGAVGLGSVVCALAGGLAVLLAGRALQGFGGALLLPQTLAVIAAAYPSDGSRRAPSASGPASPASPAGPLLGGVLVDRFGWPSVFWVNLPVVVLAIAVAAWAVREPPRRAGRRLDIPGQLLTVVGLAALTAGLIESGRLSWTSPLVLGLLGVGIAALGALARWEPQAPQPMLPLDLLADRWFRGPTS